MPDPFSLLPVLPTTVVGSFPAAGGKGILGYLAPARQALRVAVGAQIRAGIDIISDGQVRGDMVRSFTSRIPGIRGSDVVGPVLPPDGPITVPDVRYALSRHRFVKGILTGPTTLAFGLRIATPAYRDRADLAMDLAKVLAGEARALERAGVCMIQVDEPVLSTGAADPAEAQRAFSVVAAGASVPVALHVCGDLSSVIDDLWKFPADVLDIECARSPGNLSLVSPGDLGGRRVAVGCVDSADPRVEGVDEIEGRIRAAVERLGADRLLVDPDCGLRMLPVESAEGKLVHMVRAARKVREELEE
ncbi:MAG: methionine synthase [Methanolinea sp.]